MGIDSVAARPASRSRQPGLRGFALGLRLAASRLVVFAAAAVSTALGLTVGSRARTGGSTAAALAAGDDALPAGLARRSRWVDLDGPVHYLCRWWPPGPTGSSPRCSPRTRHLCSAPG